MGTVYKEKFTKSLPPGAKIIVRKGERFAEWINAKKKRRMEPVTVGKDGTDRLLITAKTYTAKYRDGSGIVRKVTTGCRDESAARSILADLERRAVRVKGKIITAAEDAVIDHQTTPINEHIEAYLMKLEAEGTSPDHRANVRRSLNRLVNDCRFIRLTDLNRVSLERWLVARSKDGMGARTRNTYRAAAVAFCNWCIETGRLLTNPFSLVPKANEESDPRRKRRALTENELIRLLDVAHRRPLVDAMTIRTGKRKGEVVANLRDENRVYLERLGRERALIYKTLVLTGLRKGELASITVGQLELDADPAYLVLKAADEKNREGSTIPLRADLVADLRAWLAEKVTALQDAAKRNPTVHFDPEAVELRKRNKRDSMGLEGQTCLSLSRLPSDTPLFIVPRDLVRILDRDLVAAGIARRVEVMPGKWKIDKLDERGRSIDVHALRHTFGTLLSKAGVAPRTAQAAMRHSGIDLTMNVYTDPKLLDVAGAMESLPALPLGDGKQTVANVLSATGTDDSMGSPLVPVLVLTTGKTITLQSIVDKAARFSEKPTIENSVDVTSYPVKQNKPLTSIVNGLHKERETGLEPATSSLGS